MSPQVVHDLVRTGRITPTQGAMLLELRRDIALARRPWWRKALSFAARVIFGRVG